MMRIGVVGCGGFGARHAAAWRNVPGASMSAVFDPDLRRAQEAAGDAHVSASLEELLKRVDAVSVVAPTSRHVDVVGRCLEAGRHVLVEKPFGTDPSAAEALCEAARRHGCVLTVGYLERFHPEIRAAIDRGVPPTRVEIERINDRRPRDPQTGLVFDLMIHDIDLVLRWFDAPIEDLRGKARLAGDGVVDEATVEIAFGGGRTASLHGSWCGARRRRTVRMMGDDGTHDIDLLPNGVDLLRAELASFLQAIRNGTPPAVTGSAAVRVLSVAQQIESVLHRCGVRS